MAAGKGNGSEATLWGNMCEHLILLNLFHHEFWHSPNPLLPPGPPAQSAPSSAVVSNLRSSAAATPLPAAANPAALIASA